MSSEVTLRCADSSSSSPEGGEGAAVPTPIGERICHYYHRAVAWAKEHPKVFWSIVLVIVAFVALLIAASFLPVDEWLQSAQNYAKSNMTTSILLIFFLIFIGAFCFLPIALLETAGSFLFGWQIGFPLTFAAYWSGSCLALLFGRYWFTAYAHTFLESLGSRGAVINRMIASHPFKMSMFVRLSVLPITVKNYVLAALPVSTWTYVITSMLGHLPFAIIYAFIGSSVSVRLLSLFFISWPFSSQQMCPLFSFNFRAFLKSCTAPIQRPPSAWCLEFCLLWCWSGRSSITTRKWKPRFRANQFKSLPALRAPLAKHTLPASMTLSQFERRDSLLNKTSSLFIFILLICC
jgi:uncharacterized membrane protein YdjX (TVP38/TMEM64 family)